MHEVNKVRQVKYEDNQKNKLIWCLSQELKTKPKNKHWFLVYFKFFKEPMVCKKVNFHLAPGEFCQPNNDTKRY